MKEKLFIQIVCDYPDYQDKTGIWHDGTRCDEVYDFNELYERLEHYLKEGVLDHVHLDFCHHENTNVLHGGIILPLVNKDVHWYQTIVDKK